MNVNELVGAVNKTYYVSDDTMIQSFKQFMLKQNEQFQTGALSISDSHKLVQLLTPVKYPLSLKRRIGSQEDGGYVIPVIGMYDHHICLGVGPDVSYEVEFQQYVNGLNLFYDHTVSTLPLKPNEKINNCHHYTKKIDVATSRNTVSLNDILDNMEGNNISLKMDIEGWEYEALSTCSDANLQRCKLIVLEMHCVGTHGDKGGGDSNNIKDPVVKMNMLEKIHKHHSLVHVAPNASTPLVLLKNNQVVPCCIEMTFVRHEFVQYDKVSHKKSNVDQYPTILDSKVPDSLVNKTHYGMQYINQAVMQSHFTVQLSPQFDNLVFSSKSIV